MYRAWCKNVIINEQRNKCNETSNLFWLSIWELLICLFAFLLFTIFAVLPKWIVLWDNSGQGKESACWNVIFFSFFFNSSFCYTWPLGIHSKEVTVSLLSGAGGPGMSRPTVGVGLAHHRGSLPAFLFVSHLRPLVTGWKPQRAASPLATAFPAFHLKLCLQTRMLMSSRPSGSLAAVILFSI